LILLVHFTDAQQDVTVNILPRSLKTGTWGVEKACLLSEAIKGERSYRIS